MEPSTLIQALVKLVDAEDISNEKNRILVLPLKNLIVSSKLETQKLPAETYDPNF